MRLNRRSFMTMVGGTLVVLGLGGKSLRDRIVEGRPPPRKSVTSLKTPNWANQGKGPAIGLPMGPFQVQGGVIEMETTEPLICGDFVTMTENGNKVKKNVFGTETSIWVALEKSKFDSQGRQVVRINLYRFLLTN